MIAEKSFFKQLKRIDRKEFELRSRTANWLPCGSSIEMMSLADLLKANSATCDHFRIGRFQDSSLDDSFALALELESRNIRAVLVMGRSLAFSLIDQTLGRQTTDHGEMCSGEEGILLYIVDQMGGDWIDAGGIPFVLKGFLFGEEMVRQYLESEPLWKVEACLTCRETVGPVAIVFGDVDIQTPRTRSDSGFNSAANRAVELKSVIGQSTLEIQELSKIAPGDVVLFDDRIAFSIDERYVDIGLVLGESSLRARWRDFDKLTLLTTWGRDEEMTGTRNAIEVANLDSKRESSGSMEVIVAIETSRLKMKLMEALNLVPGQVIDLQREAGCDVCLRMGDNILARGELVVFESGLAVEITEVE